MAGEISTVHLAPPSTFHVEEDKHGQVFMSESRS